MDLPNVNLLTNFFFIVNNTPKNFKGNLRILSCIQYNSFVQFQQIFTGIIFIYSDIFIYHSDLKHNLQYYPHDLIFVQDLI